MYYLRGLNAFLSKNKIEVEVIHSRVDKSLFKFTNYKSGNLPQNNSRSECKKEKNQSLIVNINYSSVYQYYKEIDH